MTENGEKKEHSIVLRLAKIHFDLRRHAREREQAEFFRRAALSPDEREREDRQKIALRYSAMGEERLSFESWTLDEFTALLVADLPDGEPAVDEEQRRRIRMTLESCSGVSLTPLNPSAPAELQRFRTADLVRVSQAKQLGHIAALQPVLEALSEPPLPERQPTVDTTPARSTPEPDTSWKPMLDLICTEIEQAAQRGDIERFDPAALPFSVKTLYASLADRFRKLGRGELPVKPDTVRKYLNRSRGWKSKAGYQNTATLGKLSQILKR